MDKRFAIFDFDGTLVDSAGFWQETERDFLSRRGITGDISAILEKTKPMTVPEASRFFIQTYGFDESPDAMSDEMYATMTRHYREDVPLKDGAAAYLADLAGRGVQMCVASATAARLMRECLDRMGVGSYFAFVLSCMDVGAGKLQPDVYLAAARRFGAEPGEIAVYEDAPYALRTAKQAGFYTIGVYDASAAAHWDEIRRIADESLKSWGEGAKKD